MLKTIARKFGPSPDAISILTADHRRVDELFVAYEGARNTRTKALIVKKICLEVAAHSHIEKAIFYPQVKKVLKDLVDEVNEGFVEHAAVDRLVKELGTLAPGDEYYGPKVKVLKEFLHHHVKEEESELFPKVVESDVDLKRLGETLTAAKARFLSVKKRTESA